MDSTRPGSHYKTFTYLFCIYVIHFLYSVFESVEIQTHRINYEANERCCLYDYVHHHRNDFGVVFFSFHAIHFDLARIIIRYEPYTRMKGFNNYIDVFIYY